MQNKKWLKSVAFYRLLTVVVAYIQLADSYSTSKDKGSAKIYSNDFKTFVDLCLTPGCIHAASEILKNMDPNVDPCKNFYHYACGGFLNSTIIPDDKSIVDAFTVVEDKLREQLRKSIDAESKPDERRPFRLAKILYNSCMNTTAIEAKGLEPLHAVLRRVGGWPVLEGDSWNDSDFDWMSSVYKLHNVGYVSNSLLDFSVDVDLKNSTKRLIELSEAKLGLPRENLLKGFDDEKVLAYYNYMVDIAIILGAQKDRAMKELKDSLSFEMKLAHISLPREEIRDVTILYNPMTLEELTKNYRSIQWKKFFSRMLPSSITVEENEIANVEVPSYIAALEKLIFETPKRVLANYVMWGAVAASVRYLNNEILEKWFVFEKSIGGKIQRSPRWEECFSEISNDLSIHALYARQYFNTDAKEKAIEMVTDIREQFTRMLKDADWMDDKTLERVLEKVTSMTSYIGYPEELLDDNELEKFFEKLEFSEDNYFENFLNKSLFSLEYDNSRLREPYNKSFWQHHKEVATVNAFYDFNGNNLNVPAGILQGVFFNNDRPKYMNYGAIGIIIGHEMTHGFDDEGSQFDKDGNLVDWWEPSTKENYLKRKSCIVNQYANYTVEEVQLNINGNNTQGENIADNGGLKAAYHAYNNWAIKNGPEPMLPGIDMTPHQMFWISAANVWCSKYRPELLKYGITVDPHSPGEFRVLGPMSNMPEFAIDFKCPSGSKMNPTNKCSVW